MTVAVEGRPEGASRRAALIRGWLGFAVCALVLVALTLGDAALAPQTRTSLDVSDVVGPVIGYVAFACVLSALVGLFLPSIASLWLVVLVLPVLEVGFDTNNTTMLGFLFVPVNFLVLLFAVLATIHCITLKVGRRSSTVPADDATRSALHNGPHAAAFEGVVSELGSLGYAMSPDLCQLEFGRTRFAVAIGAHTTHPTNAIVAVQVGRARRGPRVELGAIVDGYRGELTSVSFKPIAPADRTLMQALAGLDLPHLHAAHVDAMRVLEERGARWQPVSMHAFPTIETWLTRRGARDRLERPLRNVLASLQLLLLGGPRTPAVPIAQQVSMPAKLASILARAPEQPSPV